MYVWRPGCASANVGRLRCDAASAGSNFAREDVSVATKANIPTVTPLSAGRNPPPEATLPPGSNSEPQGTPNSGTIDTVNRLYPRIALGVVVLALIAWLTFERSANSSRIVALNRALASHVVGRISSAQKARLQKTLDEMLEALDVHERAAVDEPYARWRLNVYSTSPAAAAVTACGAGNALYDPLLDAIFIDEQFFSDVGYRRIYEQSSYASLVSFKEDLSFPEVYLRFALLHELGHRQLHRQLKNYRPHVSGGESEALRRLEREADQFAVAGLRKFYALDKKGKGGLVGDPLREAVGLSEFFDPDIDPQTHAYVDLVGAFFMMANFNLYLDTPYSPFFESVSHPTFLNRARGAIDALFELRELSPKFRANFALLRESLKREESVATQPFVEILCPMPVNDVGFDVDGIRIISIGNAQMFRATNATSEDARAHRVLVAKEVGARRGAIKNGLPNGGFWTRLDGISTVVDADGDVWRYAAGEWQPGKLALPVPLSTTKCFRLKTPPQPTNLALAIGCDDAESEWFSSFRRDALTAARRHSDIATDLTARLNRKIDDFDVSAVDADSVYLALEDRTAKPRLIGSARLRLTSLQVEDATLFRGEPSLFERGGDNRVWPMLISKSGTFVLGAAPRRDLLETAFSISASDDPRPVAEYEFLVHRVAQHASPDLIADFDPYLLATWSLTPDESLAYWANDSLIRFSAARHRIDVVFHPTFEGVEVRIGRGGEFAVFMRGGSRVFIFTGS
jgi:hypothetical protein